MRFLKVLFWLLLGALIAAFFIYNGGQRVQLRLWGNLVLDSALPILLIVTFLLGFLPMYLVHHATRWRLRQRLSSTERALSDLRAIHSPAPAVPLIEPDPVPAATPTPTPLELSAPETDEPKA